MKAISDFLSSWQHVILILGSLGIAVVAGIFVHPATWQALGAAVGSLFSHPAETTAAISMLAGAIATLRAAWMRQPPPPTIVLLAVLIAACASSGCATTAAYRDYAIAATIARVAVDGAEVAVTEAETACTDDTCRHQADVAKVAIDAAKTMALSLDEAVQAAQRTPGGEAVAVLNALAHSLGSFAAAWNAIAQALVPLGITLPELPPEVVALISSVSSAFPTARRIAR